VSGRHARINRELAQLTDRIVANLEMIEEPRQLDDLLQKTDQIIENLTVEHA
jgi:hypothetical protein